MAHFAKVQSGIVTQVIVVNNETLEDLEFPDSESVGQEFIASLGLEGTWKQTSYNANFRGAYAGIGYTYDQTLDAFIPPKPYHSWIIDETTGLWNSPVPRPQDENFYTWNESNQSWEIVD